MRSCQIIEYGKPLEMREYPNPEPQGTEVLVKVTGLRRVSHRRARVARLLRSR